LDTRTNKETNTRKKNQNKNLKQKKNTPTRDRGVQTTGIHC